MADGFVSGIVLAAGRSARLGESKQLLDLAGKPVLAHVLDNGRAAGLAEVILVLGHEAERIETAVAAHLAGVRVIVNPHHADGQSTSMRAGIAALDPAAQAAIFLLGDQPGAGQEVVGAVVAGFRETGAPIVMPSYGGVPANPVLIARPLFPELEAVAGDRGAREVVRAHRAEILLVPFPDRTPPRDIDTAGDYAALLAEWRGDA